MSGWPFFWGGGGNSGNSEKSEKNTISDHLATPPCFFEKNDVFRVSDENRLPEHVFLKTSFVSWNGLILEIVKKREKTAKFRVSENIKKRV